MGASSSYGAEANDDGGAVYAMELRDAGIRIWIFNRDSPPGDLRPSTYDNGTEKTGHEPSDGSSTPDVPVLHKKNANRIL